jgi:hypothetical protein
MFAHVAGVCEDAESLEMTNQYKDRDKGESLYAVEENPFCGFAFFQRS